MIFIVDCKKYVKFNIKEKVGGILELLRATVIRELKQQRRQGRRKRHLEINVWETVTIL